MAVHEIVEGDQGIRRGEGIVFQITTTNWESAPTPANISIIRLEDGQDVTAQFTNTATPNASGDIITLPKIIVPPNAARGHYRVNVPFSAGGFSPGIPFIDLFVID